MSRWTRSFTLQPQLTRNPNQRARQPLSVTRFSACQYRQVKMDVWGGENLWGVSRINGRPIPTAVSVDEMMAKIKWIKYGEIYRM